MRKLGMIALAGVGVLAIARVALAAGQDMHELKVSLPDGSIAHVEYKGDFAPKLDIAPATHFVPVALLDPFVPATFIGLDRVSEQIDQQAQALMRQVDALQAAPSPSDGKPLLTAIGKLPAGTLSYSLVSMSNGKDSCYRSVEVTSNGGAQPKIVSKSAGKCDAADEAPTHALKGDLGRSPSSDILRDTAVQNAVPKPSNTA